MKIKTNTENLYGQVVNLPVQGKVVVGKDGTVEVSDECGELLINNSNGAWFDPDAVAEDSEESTTEEQPKSPAKSPKPKKTAAKVVEDVEDEEIAGEGETEKGSEDEGEGETSIDELIEHANALSLSELVKLAQDSGYPAAEYENKVKNKLVMRNYIIKKLKESAD